MSEKNIQSEIMLEVSRSGARVFRNNTGVALAISAGTAWGAVVRKCIAYVGKLGFKASPIKYGLCEGSSDLIGFKKIRITPDMIGKYCCIFIALEVKSRTGKLAPEQLNFLRTIKNNGGIAALVRSSEDALDAINNYEPMDAVPSREPK